MNNIYITFGLLLYSFACFSQNIFTSIDGKKVSFFIEQEERIKSKLFDSRSNHISFDGSAQPIIYRRKEKTIPDLLVSYTFYKKDSIVNTIFYEWNVYNFDEKENNPQSKSFQKAMILKYNELLNIFSLKYGKSSMEGSLDKDDEGIIFRKDKWELNDTTNIELFIVLSNNYEKKGNVTSGTTHKIRLYVQSKRKPEIPKLDEKSIEASNQNFQFFIQKLKENKIEESKAYLSNLIVKSVTNEQLIDLQKRINFNKKIIIHFRGLQMVPPDKNYLMIHYKYEDDSEQIPKSIIKVLFDEENKLLGINTFEKN